MAGVGRDERFVENERRILEAGIEIAVRPFVGRLAHRQAAMLFLREVRLGPLEFRDHGCGRDFAPRRRGRRAQTLPSVRGFGPPGRRVSSGSTTKGSGSKSI